MGQFSFLIHTVETKLPWDSCIWKKFACRYTLSDHVLPFHKRCVDLHASLQILEGTVSIPITIHALMPTRCDIIMPYHVIYYGMNLHVLPYPTYILYIYIYIYNYYTSMLLKEYIYFSSRWYFQMNIFGRCSSSSSLIWHCSLIVKMNIHLVSGLTQMNGKIIVLLCDKGYINN